MNTPPVLPVAPVVSAAQVLPAAPVISVAPVIPLVPVVSTAPLARMPSKKKIRTAGAIYLRRRDRIDHPNGKFDKAGRWYPDASEKLDKTQYRSPSAAYPWSYMHACRTIKHAAKLGGVPHHAAEVRHQAKRIVSEAALLGRTLDVFTAQILAGTA